MSAQSSIISTLEDKFTKLLPRLGLSNKKGTVRHRYEVEFCYAMRAYGLREFQAINLIGKIVSNLEYDVRNKSQDVA